MMFGRSLLLAVIALITPFTGLKGDAQLQPTRLTVFEIEYSKNLRLMRTFSEMVAHFGAERSADEWSVLVTKKDRPEPERLVKLFRREPRPSHLKWLTEKLRALEVCVQKKICPTDAPVQPLMKTDAKEITFFRSSTDISGMLKDGFMFELKTIEGVLFLFSGLGALALSPEEQLFVAWVKP